jgi:hypothetical protein
MICKCYLKVSEMLICWVILQRNKDEGKVGDGVKQLKTRSVC